MKKNLVSVKLGRRIAKFRRGAGLSQEKLAFRAGLHRTFIGMVERGERNITILNFLRIASALQITPGELLDPLGETAPKNPDESLPSIRQST